MPSDDVSFRSVSSVIEISLAKLQAGEPSVEAAFYQQLLVGACRNQPALVKHRAGLLGCITQAADNYTETTTDEQGSTTTKTIRDAQEPDSERCTTRKASWKI